MVGAEVPKEEHVYAAGFDRLAKVFEGFGVGSGGAVLGQSKVELFGHSGGELGRGEADGDRVDEFDGFGLIVFENRADKVLTGFYVADEGVEFGVGLFADWERAEVLAAIAGLGWFG